MKSLFVCFYHLSSKKKKSNLKMLQDLSCHSCHCHKSCRMGKTGFSPFFLQVMVNIKEKKTLISVFFEFPVPANSECSQNFG